MTGELGELGLLLVPRVVSRRVLEERRSLTVWTVLALELWAVPLVPNCLAGILYALWRDDAAYRPPAPRPGAVADASTAFAEGDRHER